ncbi:hypothetical protein CRENBAI_003370 [Crenichthys baileyi]|uniref:Uncharacterized protein n=1 Tax=Crenichthys baileyi TaxID=28760 RepID=A0AAV9S295_9TELE
MRRRFTVNEALDHIFAANEAEDTQVFPDGDDQTSENEHDVEYQLEETDTTDQSEEEVTGAEAAPAESFQSKRGNIRWSTVPPDVHGRTAAANIIKMTPGVTRASLAGVASQVWLIKSLIYRASKGAGIWREASARLLHQPVTDPGDPRFLFHVLSKRESDTELNRSRRESPYHSCLQPCCSENASRKRPNSCPPACPPFGIVHSNKDAQARGPNQREETSTAPQLTVSAYLRHCGRTNPSNRFYTTRQ